MILPNSKCPICLQSIEFSSDDDYVSCRSKLISKACPNIRCAVRERAVAKVLRELYSEDEFHSLRVHQAAPMDRGLTLWLRNELSIYLETGYFPDKKFGAQIGNLRNEDLENQTFDDDSFDLVIHSDVLEHVYNPFLVIREIERTLVSGGRCIFTVPTQPGRVKSEQIAFIDKSGKIKTIGEPKYHGNPQSSKGSLVTWLYGYDLPLLISRKTTFDVTVTRWQSKSDAIMGIMTEVYVLTKQ